jgi:oligosaccharyltransferase complex subunit alpha (ribophorin I)
MRDILVFLAIALCLFSSVYATEVADLLVEDIDRSIDASNNNIVRQDIKVTLVNSGSSSGVTVFHFALPKQFAQDHVSLLTVHQNDKQLSVSAGHTNEHNQNALFYEVQLSTALQSKQKTTLNINLILTNKIIVPFPTHIEQQEQQKVLYKDNLYFFSPYRVRSQKTTVKLGTSSVESYSQDVRPVSNQGSSIVYGPYSEQKPYSEHELKVHFTNNKPYVVISSVERIIEVSHWGNLAIEEHYDLRHDGAVLKGPFSRYDYSKNPYQTAPSSFRELTAKLPLHASDIYFRDRIGNISSSNVRVSGSDLLVDFLPRFPLFGGWRIRFYIGWNLPIQHYLSHEGEQFKLKTSFSVPFDFATIDELTLKIILPEGAQNAQVKVPFRIDSEHRENLKTYLDVYGREVIVIKKTKLAPEHNQPFTVSYDFPTTTIAGEPLMVITALFAFCLLVIFVNRFDLTIRKSEYTKREDAYTRIQEQAEQYIYRHTGREVRYGQLENALLSITARNTTDHEDVFRRVQAERNEIETAIHRDIINPIKDLTNSVLKDQTVALRILETIQNIERKEKERFEAMKTLLQEKKRFVERNLRDEKPIKDATAEYDRLSDEIFVLIEDLKDL